MSRSVQQAKQLKADKFDIAYKQHTIRSIFMVLQPASPGYITFISNQLQSIWGRAEGPNGEIILTHN